MANKKKDQHYVPQMYLRRFTDSHNQVYVYDLEKKRGYRNLPRKFAFEKYFYDLDPSSTYEILEEYAPFLTEERRKSLADGQLVEEWLSGIEGSANTVLDELERGKTTAEVDMVPIASFIYTLSKRTRKRRVQIQRIGESSNLFTKEIAKKEHIKSVISLSGVNRFCGVLLMNYSCCVANVDSDVSLIISDNPSLIFDLAVENFCFPISPKKALIFRRRESKTITSESDMFEDRIITLGTSSVMTYNLIQRKQALRFLYGDEATIKHMIEKEETK